jgi:iron complex transport system substrate-binding protein
VLDGAIRIHRALGPGLLESAYLVCLEYELTEAQLRIERQPAVPLVNRGVRIDCGFRADIVVEGSVLIEVKAQEAIAPIHSRQLQTYLRIGQYPVGLLLNFGAPSMKAGIRRIVNGFPDEKRPEEAEGAEQSKTQGSQRSRGSRRKDGGKQKPPRVDALRAARNGRGSDTSVMRIRRRL